MGLKVMKHIFFVQRDLSPIYQFVSRKYVHKMWSNRILVQAVGIPLKHALALYGLSLCLLVAKFVGFLLPNVKLEVDMLCFQGPTPPFIRRLLQWQFPNHMDRSYVIERELMSLRKGRVPHL